MYVDFLNLNSNSGIALGDFSGDLWGSLPIPRICVSCMISIHHIVLTILGPI